MSDKKVDDHRDRLSSPNALNNDSTRFTPRSATQRNNAYKESYFQSFENSPAASIIAYCFASISMTLVNKYIVSGRSWNLHILYLAIQHIICSVAIIGGKKLQLVKGMDPWDTAAAKKCFPVAMMLVGMIYTGNKALQFLSVPIYTIFKNLTVIVIAYGEVLWLGGHVSPLSLVAFILMVISSIIAAWSDLSHAQSTVALDAKEPLRDVWSLNVGYCWMLLNVVTTAVYTLGMRIGFKTSNIKNWNVIYYNNVLTIPVLLLASLVMEDWSSANLEKNFPYAARQSLIVSMIYSGLGAILISYCTAWCIKVTSSTTYAMTGALNKLPLAIAGIIFFTDPVTFGGVVAIIMGFVSGLIYNFSKNNKPKQANGLLPTSSQIPMSASSRSRTDAMRG